MKEHMDRLNIEGVIRTSLMERMLNSFSHASPGKLREHLVDSFGKNFPFPQLVQIQTSNRCNLHCKMCPTYGEFNRSQSAHLRKDDPVARFLDPATFEHILGQIRQFNTGLARRLIKIKPQLYDEPLLNPHTIDYVRIARARGVENIYFDTNGTLLTPAICEKLVGSGLSSISISIDASCESTYALLRRNSHYRHVCDMVKYLCALRDRKNPGMVVDISLVEVRENAAEIGEFIDQWLPVSGCVRINKAFDSLGKVDGFYVPSTGRRLLCKVPWRITSVLQNGDVIKCMFDYNYDEVVGNIFEDSLIDLWKGPVYMSYREKHVEGRFEEIPSCSTCDCWVRRGIVNVRTEGNRIIVENHQEMSVFPYSWLAMKRLQAYRLLLS
jgi:radical SAM protein with 4Fe4S-binding SPASM domain